MIKEILWVVTGLLIIPAVILAFIYQTQSAILLAGAYVWCWGVFFVMYLVRIYKRKQNS